MTHVTDLLPATWPTEIVDALAVWHQGHLIKQPPFFWAAATGHPLLPFTNANADTSREWQVFALPSTERPPFGVIVSQTCDICEPSPNNPFINIAPVIDLSEIVNDGQQVEITRHLWNDYIYLTSQPVGGRFYVADLRVFLPIEKGALVGRTPIEGFSSEMDRLDFSDRLAARLRRPAYADAVSDMLITPLNKWIKDESKAALKAGSGRFTDVEEVRLRIDGDRLNPKAVQVIVFEESPLARSDRAEWRKWRERTRSKLQRETGITLWPIQFTSLSKMSAADHRLLTPVWLRALGREPQF